MPPSDDSVAAESSKADQRTTMAQRPQPLIVSRTATPAGYDIAMLVSPRILFPRGDGEPGDAFNWFAANGPTAQATSAAPPATDANALNDGLVAPRPTKLRPPSAGELLLSLATPPPSLFVSDVCLSPGRSRLQQAWSRPASRQGLPGGWLTSTDGWSSARPLSRGDRSGGGVGGDGEADSYFNFAAAATYVAASIPTAALAVGTDALAAGSWSYQVQLDQSVPAASRPLVSGVRIHSVASSSTYLQDDAAAQAAPRVETIATATDPMAQLDALFECADTGPVAVVPERKEAVAVSDTAAGVADADERASQLQLGGDRSRKRKAAARADGSGKRTRRRRTRPPPTPEELEQRRRRAQVRQQKNRQAAKRCRERKQAYYETLDGVIAELRAENDRLRAAMDAATAELDALQAPNAASASAACDHNQDSDDASNGDQICP